MKTQITEDQLLQEWLNSRRRSESTKYEYIKRMNRFCMVTGMTPTELIEQAEDEEETIPRMRKRKIKQYLLDFRQSMEDKDFSRTTVSDTMVTIRSFYRNHDIMLPSFANTTLPDNSNQIRMEDLPNLKHVEQILGHCNPRYKAIILLGLSSGMGGAELRSLKIKDFLKAHQVKSLDEIDESQIPTWNVTRVKVNMAYYTFSSPESNSAIMMYLKTRKNLDDESWLFSDQVNPISINTLTGYMKRMNDKCSFGYVGKQRFFHVHILRKIFASTCVNNGMEMTDSEWLIGHKIQKMAGIYTKPSIARLKNEYIKVLPKLSITPVKAVTMTSDEAKDLLKRLELAERKIELFEKIKNSESDQ